MVLVLKKGAGKEAIDVIEKKLKASSSKGFNARKHNGVLNIKGDALEIQKSYVMNGKEILVDTNIVIYLLQGDDTLERILQGKELYIFFISELELYGFHTATKDYENRVANLLNDCIVVPMNTAILKQYKALRKTYKLKLADSVVAATALCLDMPIMTADKQFKKQLT